MARDRSTRPPALLVLPVATLLLLGLLIVIGGCGGDEPSKDEVFLEALRLGMPPSGGVALGFDRLCMLLLEKKDLRSVLPFMDERQPDA